MGRLGAGAGGLGYAKAWAGSAGAEVWGCEPPSSRFSAQSVQTHTCTPCVNTPAGRAPRGDQECGGRDEDGGQLRAAPAARGAPRPGLHFGVAQ